MVIKNTSKGVRQLSRRQFSALLVSGCQNSRRARTRFSGAYHERRESQRRTGQVRQVERRTSVGGGKKIARTVRRERSQKSQEVPRFFRVVSAYNRTADLILIRGTVFWRPRANRGPSMIHARRHESGISPSRAPPDLVRLYRVSSFGPSCTFWPFAFSFVSLVRHLSSVFSLSRRSSPFPSFLLFRVFLGASRRPRMKRVVSSFFSFVSSPPSSLLGLRSLHLIPIFLYLRYAFSCLANGEEPREAIEIRTSRVYTIGLARLSSKRFSFSLCATP